MKNFEERRKTKKWKLDRTNNLLVTVLFSVQLLFALNVSGQQAVTVSGTVTDQTGQPLPGATVVEEGTTNGTVTNADGVYTITVPGNADLAFSFVGMKTQKVAVNSRTRIDIKFEEESIGLEEVVAIGYGTQRKREITGSISTVSSEELENRPVTRIEQALQGMVSGLNIVNTSGQPGNSSIDLKIRGISTFSNNPVLTLIDGIPSSLDRINPNDIESISVLKDAASAAIYGSRATGGVILITTKTGKAGKPKIQISSIVSMQSPSRFPEKVSAMDQALLANEARANDGLPPKYSEEEINTISSPGFKEWDWDDYMLRNALQTNQNISMSGGNEYHDYYLSFGYLYQDGIVLNSDYERFNIQLNHNVKIFKNLTLSSKFGYSPSIRTYPAMINFSHIAQKSKIHGIKTDDGKWLKHPEATGSGMNPIADASEEGGQELQKAYRISGNISLNYEILPGWNIAGTYGLVQNQSRLRNYQAKITYWEQYDPDVIAAETEYNILTINNASDVLQNASLTTDYSKSINDHRFMIMAGVTSEWYEQQNDYVQTKDFLTDNIYAINAGSKDKTLWNISGEAADWALASAIARATYSYKEKYLFSGTVRHDGSSRFKEDRRWGTFPSASVGWIISQEGFLEDNAVLTFLKLRGSWGQVGNQNASSYYPFASTLTQSAAYFNGAPQRAVGTGGTPNSILTWENKGTINIGLEGNIFSNLFEFNVDLFKERTHDILLTLPVPTTFGQSAPVQNAGTVDNRGWELELRHRNTIGEFNYGISFQVSDATNKVIDMKGISPRISGNNITEEGHPMNEWFGYRAIGMFQTPDEVADSPFQNPITSPGDLKFEENGGDTNSITSDDRIRLGRSDIRFPFGVRLTMNYKNFDFTAFGQGVMHQLLLAEGMVANAFNQDNSTLRTYHLDRWTPQNPDARFPKLRNGQAYTVNSQFSSFWLQDASYFRLKHIELGYSFPSSILSNKKINTARIFVSAENLFVITKYLGYDPEQPNAVSYPLPKLVNIGLNLNF